MCGICGILAVDGGAGGEEFRVAIGRMTRLMARRGPDDEATWADPAGRLQLGFRRLAVLDPSPRGRQPMMSADGRSVIILNGEIYNFPELRHELEQSGIRFRSTSDTEVLLEALNRWGEHAVPRLNGMFAFAWYSLADRVLILGRDHAGIKPLYYFTHPSGKGVAFASQFDALLTTPWGPPGPLRSDVLRLYLRLQHVPAPYGLLEHTSQLEPGHLLRVEADGSMQTKPWWTLPRTSTPDLRADEAREALADVLDRAVRRQRASDVPLGVFVSGGVDSPLVAAIARQQAGPGLKAFTMSSPGWAQDETAAAKAYARVLDLEHRVKVMGESVIDAVEQAAEAMYEPLGDFSILPTLQVSALARREVTVALSGDGGDELFFGYERPVSLLRNGADFQWPLPLRMALYAAGRSGLRARRSDAIVYRDPGEYYFEVNTRIADRDLDRLAPELGGLPADFGLYSFGRYQGTGHLAGYSRWVEFYGQLQRVLKKVDMASMHYGLEVRVPILDREVIDLSLRIDPRELMRDGARKVMLRELLATHVPADMIPPRKLGFSAPLSEWLRGPLRPLVEDSLLDGALVSSGLFDQAALRAYWADHLSGRRDLKWGIWTLLAMHWWLQRVRLTPTVASPV